jgi:hypothetical protein
MKELIAEIEHYLNEYPHVAYIDMDNNVRKMATSHMERLLAYVKEFDQRLTFAEIRATDAEELKDIYQDESLKLREVLAFYADDSNYNVDYDCVSIVNLDQGGKARKLLEEIDTD